MRPSLPAWRFLLAVVPLLILRYPKDKETEHLHTILSGFLSRGQLVVETFPPFTYIVRDFLTLLTPTSLDISPLGVSNAIAELLLVTSGILAFNLDFHSTSLWITQLVDITALLPVLFGCNWSDVLLITLLNQAKRLFLAFRHLANSKISLLEIVLQLIVPPVSAVLCTFCCLIATYTVVFPMSEISSRGNYNLRYLPANLRRSLRFSETPDTITTRGSGNLHVPFEKPVTLYIQNAGFLWSDSAVWDAGVSAFGLDDYVRTVALSSGSSAYKIPQFLNHRVVFEDRIKRSAPWVLQSVSSVLTTDTSPVEQPLLFVRNFHTGEFLTAASHVRSIVDEHTDFRADDGFRRHFVSTTSAWSDESMWLLEHNGDVTKGFRLRNPASRCYLGSTFRSFPDMLADRTNDTLLHQLYMTLESACISSPTRLASTIHLVDGAQHQYRANNSAAAILSNAWSILCAQYRLHSFRAWHAHLQDVPPELLPKHVPFNSGGISVPVILSLSLGYLARRFAYLKRMDTEREELNQFMRAENHHLFFCNYFLGALFMSTHLVIVFLLRFNCPYGHRVPTAIAILTIADIWRDTSLEYYIE